MVVFAGAALGFAVRAWVAAATPSPSRTGSAISGGRSVGFFVILGVLVGALLFSAWRLRRGR